MSSRDADRLTGSQFCIYAFTSLLSPEPQCATCYFVTLIAAILKIVLPCSRSRADGRLKTAQACYYRSTRLQQLWHHGCPCLPQCMQPPRLTLTYTAASMQHMHIKPRRAQCAKQNLIRLFTAGKTQAHGTPTLPLRCLSSPDSYSSCKCTPTERQNGCM